MCPCQGILLNEDDRAWQALTAAHTAVVQRVKADLAPVTTLTIGEIEVLERLLSSDRGIRMADLAELVLTSRSGLTRRLDRLERKGLAARIAAADDGRGTRATLTPAGEELARSVVPRYRASLTRHFTQRLGSNQESLVAALEEIAGS